MKRGSIVAAAVLGAMFAASAPAMASTSMEEASAQEIVAGMAGKGVRGISNAAFGWLEFPKQIYINFAEKGPAQGLAVGPLMGVGMTVVRTVAGVVEVGTFFLPIPGFYDPLVKPDYAWQKE